jgi:hypothetical protein
MALLVWLHNRKRYASANLNNTTIQIQQTNNNCDTDPAAMQLLRLSPLAKHDTYDDDEDIADPAVSTLTTPLNDAVNPPPVAAATVASSRRRLSIPLPCIASASRTHSSNRRRSLEHEHVEPSSRRDGVRKATRTLSIVSRSSLTDVREEQRVVNT